MADGGASGATPASAAQRLADQGAELAAAGKFDAAAATFRQALQLDGSSAEAHEMLAQCLMAAGEDGAAYEAAAAAVQLRPGWPPALLTLGRAARNAGRLRDAAAALSEYSASAEAAAAAAAAAADGGSADKEEAAEARRELAEVQQLLQLELGHQIGLPGLRLLEQRGAAAGPAGVAWEAGALLAWFLVQQAGNGGGGGSCGHAQCAEQSACGHPAVHGSSSAAAAAPAPAAAATDGASGLLRGARVLELGAGGTGLVGLSAACLGAAVTATDLPEVLPQLQAAVAANAALVAAAGGSLSTAALDWCSPDLALLRAPAAGGAGSNGGGAVGVQQPWDWLLGADLVYSLGPVDALVASIAGAAQACPGLCIVLSHKHRHEAVDAALLDGLRAAGVPLAAVLRDSGSRCTVFANDAARAALRQ